MMTAHLNVNTRVCVRALSFSEWRVGSKFLEGSLLPAGGFTMKRLLFTFLVLGVCGRSAVAVEATAADGEFFEKKVRPLLVEQCFSCHGNGKTKGGLDASSRARLHHAAPTA